MSMAAILSNYSPEIQHRIRIGLRGFVLSVVVGVVFFKSCGKQIGDSGNNSFLTGARMTPLLFVNGTDTTKPKVDSVALWNAHLDSVLTHTSIRDFDNWLQENATIKVYKEGKFQDFVSSFIQFQYQLWISKNKK